VFLSGNFETLHARMQARTQHFMPAQLLQSQLEILEPPAQALQLDIEMAPEEIVERIIKALYHFPGLLT
jgi:gluconate kinase